MPEHEIIDDTKPWLVIPYFPGDLGRKGIERNPLPPPPAVWYLCAGVRVNGGPLRVYPPGVPFTVDVDVRNYGGGAAETPVAVTVWWSDPTAGFGGAKWFGAATPVLAAKGGAATVTITGTIPAGAPSHVCLLVSVEAMFNDNLPAVIAPGLDRHWAQLNIDAVTAPAGVFSHTVQVGNPYQVPARVHVRARLLTGDRLAAVARALQVEPFQPDRVDLHVRTQAGAEPPERLEGAVPVELDAGGSVALEMRGELSPPPQPGTAAVVEIVQYAPFDQDAAIGALAVAVTSD